MNKRLEVKEYRVEAKAGEGKVRREGRRNEQVLVSLGLSPRGALIKGRAEEVAREVGLRYRRGGAG